MPAQNATLVAAWLGGTPQTAPSIQRAFACQTRRPSLDPLPCGLLDFAAKCLLMATFSDEEDGRGGFRTCDLSRVKRALSH